ncbi:uncharacterized protein LOC128558680 isoform X2 [Mercenaria mercenaria]|nr:uncharacterized protein LOC128558680 isoform X2 [Mercenaria mercenaria]XP_053404699.1 uncharacterized protein LOC128558680 isoform X2 [Mercenaria mercenaria]
MAGKDITDDICVDLRSRRLVHVSEGKHENQAASQSKTFLEEHANFSTSSCQENITRVYDGINFLGVSNDTEPAKGPESVDLLLHTENTCSSKQIAEKVIVPMENEAFHSSKVMSEKSTSEDCFGEQDIAVNPMTESTGNSLSTVQGYPGNVPLETALNQLPQTVLNSAFQKAGNMLSKTVVMPLSRGTVTLPPYTAENVLAKRGRNSMSKMTQNLPPQKFENISSQVDVTTMPKATHNVTPKTAKEMLPKTLDGQFLITVNSLPQTGDNLLSDLLPQTAQNLQLQTTQNIQPPTAQNIWAQRTQNILPQTAQNLQPETIQNLLPPTQSLLHQLAQILKPQTTQNIMPLSAQNLQPPTTRSIWPLTAHDIWPQTTQNILSQTTQNIQPETIQNLQPQKQNLLSQTAQITLSHMGMQSPIQVTQSLPHQEIQYLLPEMTGLSPVQTVHNLQSEKVKYLPPQSTFNILSPAPANDVSQVAVPVQHDVYSGYTGSECPISVCSYSSASLSRSQSVSSIHSDTDKKYYTCNSEVKHALQNKICSKGQGQQEWKKRSHPYPNRYEGTEQVQYQTTLPNLPVLNSCLF